MVGPILLVILLPRPCDLTLTGLERYLADELPLTFCQREVVACAHAGAHQNSARLRRLELAHNRHRGLAALIDYHPVDARAERQHLLSTPEAHRMRDGLPVLPLMGNLVMEQPERAEVGTVLHAHHRLVVDGAAGRVEVTIKLAEVEAKLRLVEHVEGL